MLVAVSLCARADDLCPVCQTKLVDITTQKDDESKPSKNLEVWNRSSCSNPFFGKGSLFCLRDGYAYEDQLKRWELSLLDRDGFAYPLDRRIHDLPLPERNKIKSGTVYSQEFRTLEAIKHGLLFWMVIDEHYFSKIRQYAKTNGIDLVIEPHKNRGEAVIRASLTTRPNKSDDTGGKIREK